jgi:hypothetical protein
MPYGVADIQYWMLKKERLERRVCRQAAICIRGLFLEGA